MILETGAEVITVTRKTRREGERKPIEVKGKHPRLQTPKRVSAQRLVIDVLVVVRIARQYSRGPCSQKSSTLVNRLQNFAVLRELAVLSG